MAGAYTSTYGGNALNYTKSGYNIHATVKAEKVEETDQGGLTLLDYIYRGAQVSIDAIFKVFTAFSAGGTGFVPWQWGATLGNVYSSSNPIGRLASASAAALILTAVTGTPAAGAGLMATLTAALAIVSPDNDMTLVLNSIGRDVPLKWDVLLKDTTGTGQLIVVT